MTQGSATVAGYRARVASTRQTATVSARPVGQAWYRRGGPLLAVGAAAFGVALAGYIIFALTSPSHQWMDPVDLKVYLDGGRIVRHIAPFYRGYRAAPLYGWPGYAHLPFTYSPFAAMVFTVLTLFSFMTLAKITVGVNIAAMLATIWMTLGGLGCRRDLARLGATLLMAAPLLWTEPIQRTLFLGQIEIVLMTLIIWDQVQPDRRWWKGAGIGIGAGIDLIPLIFIPYLVLTRRFRQAAVATGTFAATFLIGFAVLPADSRRYWLTGLFAHGPRTGFVGWEGNQSLPALITRLTGNVLRAQPTWLAVDAVVLIAGVICAALIDRAGHRMAGLLTCALTGLLCSPISWDHHWVWVVPGVVTAAVYAVRARGAWRWAMVSLAAGLVLVFGAWPGSLWHLPGNTGGYFEGLIWVPPLTNPETYLRIGDKPWYAEYHWHGLQLLFGNLYVLTGMALFAALLVVGFGPAVRAALAARRSGRLTPASAAPEG
jgi:alpha-1,2-mannosyltransferase